MQKNDNLKWSLDDICKINDFDELYKDVKKELDVTEKWWAKLNPEMSIEEFRKFLEYDQIVDEKFSRLSYLPSLMLSVDQKNTQARLMSTKVDDLSLIFSQKTRKVGHWLKGLEVEGKKTLDDKNAKRLFKAIKDLEYGLNYSRQAAKYTLSQKEEEIIENKDVNGSGTISDLRGLIEADLVYKMGKRKITNQAELLKHVHSANKNNRKNAYKALFTEHKKNIDKFFAIYQSVVKDWGFEAKLRGYESPISVRNFANHVPDKAIEVLLKVCQEEREIFWKYFEYKAKSLRVKKLDRFDLYAPKKGVVVKKYSIKESEELVMDSFKQFSTRFVDYAKRVFEQKHIDSHPGKSKRSGAFCATVHPKITPYVLLNHTGTLRDVSTLAHELGHAIHSMYAEKHLAGAQHANLPLSETASTLGEMILFENLLSKEKDKEVRRQMLWEKIADSYATILRQNYFILFEIEAHKLIAEGITAKDLSKAYLKNLKEQFGPSVKLDPIFQYEWLYISHIFESPFYCYAYNFGELLSMSLFARYKKEGKSFIPVIEKILEAGGSVDPKEVLDNVGVDMESEEFWRGGFEILKGWQKTLESI